MKIVYITESLVTAGGVEKMLSEKANYLADVCGYDVTIIVCSQSSLQSNYFTLSSSVNQINLNIPLYAQYRYKYPKRLWIKYLTNKQLKSVLSETIHKLSPDIIVGMGHFKADIICDIECKAKKIIESHEARMFTQSGLSQHQSRLSGLYQKYYRKHYFKKIEKKADVVVTLTGGDKVMWGKAKRVEVIPNFSTMPIISLSNCNAKRIISVGRLSWEKGYDRLLKIWETISPRFPDWHLDIFGEGELKQSINSTIADKGLKNIFIHNFTKSINTEYAKSSICVVTSYFEGFSLVLLEALKHGVPCIAFDCPFGPSSILENERSGFLIEDGNVHLFIEKLSLLMNDIDLRKKISKEAVQRSEVFSINRVMRQWEELFESLCTTKQNATTDIDMAHT